MTHKFLVVLILLFGVNYAYAQFDSAAAVDNAIGFATASQTVNAIQFLPGNRVAATYASGTETTLTLTSANAAGTFVPADDPVNVNFTLGAAHTEMTAAVTSIDTNTVDNRINPQDETPFNLSDIGFGNQDDGMELHICPTDTDNASLTTDTDTCEPLIISQAGTLEAAFPEVELLDANGSSTDFASRPSNGKAQATSLLFAAKKIGDGPQVERDNDGSDEASITVTFTVRDTQ